MLIALAYSSALGGPEIGLTASAASNILAMVAYYLMKADADRTFSTTFAGSGI
jgi:hypothetical protein